MLLLARCDGLAYRHASSPTKPVSLRQNSNLSSCALPTSRRHLNSRNSNTCGCKALAGNRDGLLRPLLIDNYDSYTYNLYQIVSEVYGVSPLVVHNDAVDIQQVQDMLATGDVHHIILSPGPGSPDVPQDIGVCMDVLQLCPSTPVLGVCLGHQALALAAGGRVVRAPEPVHGRLSSLRHSSHPLFAGCPSGPGAGFDVVRYHSLIVDADSLPEVLTPLAWTCGQHQPLAVQQLHDTAMQPAAAVAASQLQPCLLQQQKQQQQQQQTASHQQQLHQHQLHNQQQQHPQDLLMALAHRHRPHYGVQFHPESIASQYGIQVLMNFRDLAYAASGQLVPQVLQAAGLKGRGPPGRCLQPWPWPVAAEQQLQQQQQGLSHLLPTDVHDAPHTVSRQQQQMDPAAVAGTAAGLWPAAGVGSELQLSWQQLRGVLGAAGGTQGLFEALVGPNPDTFWLDSSSAPERARFSYMGSSSGPLWRQVTYKLPQPQQQQQQQQHAGLLHICNSAGQHQTSVRLSIWDYLQQQLERLKLPPSVAAAAAEQLPFDFWGGFVGYFGYELKAECGGSNAHAADSPDATWQFADRVLVADHVAGDVYLLALHDTAAAAVQDAQQWLQQTAAAVRSLVDNSGSGSSGQQRQWQQSQQAGSGSRISAIMPVVAVAAVEAPVKQQPVLQQQQQQPGSLQNPPAAGFGLQQQQQQFQHPMQRQQQQWQQQAVGAPTAAAAPAPALPPGWSLRHDEAQYLSNVAACKEALYAGESYELCLTTSLHCSGGPPDPWQYYKHLRSHNPAPYSAWMSFAGTPGTQRSSNSSSDSSECLSSSSSSSGIVPAVVVCCSSPERFLQGGRGGVLEAKPIKGTARRSPDPAADAAAAAALQGSEKERAENLMIVDLLRNDLGKVCEPGSVHVPGLVQLESYASVHQLVSTVRGLKRRGVSGVEAIRAAFPGGSMTGAPKIRSMAILDGLEGVARGVYSGALGYLSVNDTFDLNIVIRSAVFVAHNEGSTLPSTGTTDSALMQGSTSGEAASGSDPTSSSSASCNSGSSSSHAASCPGQMRMSVGAGGAIVVQSDPSAEFAEMQLKAERLLQAAARCL